VKSRSSRSTHLSFKMILWTRKLRIGFLLISFKEARYRNCKKREVGRPGMQGRRKIGAQSNQIDNSRNSLMMICRTFNSWMKITSRSRIRLTRILKNWFKPEKGRPRQEMKDIINHISKEESKKQLNLVNKNWKWLKSSRNKSEWEEEQLT